MGTTKKAGTMTIAGHEREAAECEAWLRDHPNATTAAEIVYSQMQHHQAQARKLRALVLG